MPRGSGARSSSGRFAKRQVTEPSESARVKSSLEIANERFLGKIVLDRRQGNVFKVAFVDQDATGIYVCARGAKRVKIEDVRLQPT